MSEPTPNPNATEPPVPEDPKLLKTVRNRGPGSLVFGCFRLIRELGAEAIAVVWLTNDERYGLEVAVWHPWPITTFQPNPTGLLG